MEASIMKLTKLVALLLVVCMTACMFISCKPQNDGKLKIGILQLAPHPALDAATEGFKQVIIEAYGEENVEFIFVNAQGDSNACTSAIANFVSQKVDLIMANATNALQAANNGTMTIPILGTSITEYGVALNLDNFNGTVGGNVSGTSDLAPLDQQADMMVDTLSLKAGDVVGLLYCSSEDNSVYQVKKVKEQLGTYGIVCNGFWLY